MTRVQIDIICMAIHLTTICVTIPLWIWRRKQERRVQSLRSEFRKSDLLSIVCCVSATVGIIAIGAKYLPPQAVNFTQ